MHPRAPHLAHVPTSPRAVRRPPWCSVLLLSWLPSFIKKINIIFYNCVGTSMNVIQARFILMYLLLFSLFILFLKKLKLTISRGP